MPTLRPLLAVRLIGPAATVTAEKEHLIARITDCLGGNVTIRISTHSARHAGEIRVYITVSLKESHAQVRRSALGGTPGR